MTRTARINFIVFFVFMALLGALAFGALPKLWARSAPAAIQEHFPNVTIGSSDFRYSPPRLVFKDIHVLNTAEFGGEDAIRIGQVELLLGGYRYNPLVIRSITVQDIKGKLVTKGTNDNFSILYQKFLNKRDEVPVGGMARETKLERVFFRNSSIQNYDGSIIYPIADTNFEPVGALTGTVTVQYVIADVLATIARQQSEAAPALMVKSTGEKLKDTVKSIGQAIENYLNSP